MRSLSWVLSTQRWVSPVCSVGAHGHQELGIKHEATVVNRVGWATWKEKNSRKRKMETEKRVKEQF